MLCTVSEVIANLHRLHSYIHAPNLLSHEGQVPHTADLTITYLAIYPSQVTLGERTPLASQLSGSTLTWMSHHISKRMAGGRLTIAKQTPAIIEKVGLGHYNFPQELVAILIQRHYGYHSAWWLKPTAKLERLQPLPIYNAIPSPKAARCHHIGSTFKQSSERHCLGKHQVLYLTRQSLSSIALRFYPDGIGEAAAPVTRRESLRRTMTLFRQVTPHAACSPCTRIVHPERTTEEVEIWGDLQT